MKSAQEYMENLTRITSSYKIFYDGKLTLDIYYDDTIGHIDEVNNYITFKHAIDAARFMKNHNYVNFTKINLINIEREEQIFPWIERKYVACGCVENNKEETV